ncbi:hypothetical protein VTN49DRAFT_1209 [Thermomyces lanuginosus]|uniref:uncharacterized protein n=1 Tax=Thermomyces lanuginosus TaxID=5541 RepID=UPI0037423E7B
MLRAVEPYALGPVPIRMGNKNGEYHRLKQYCRGKDKSPMMISHAQHNRPPKTQITHGPTNKRMSSVLLERHSSVW